MGVPVTLGMMTKEDGNDRQVREGERCEPSEVKARECGVWMGGVCGLTVRCSVPC